MNMLLPFCKYWGGWDLSRQMLKDKIRDYCIT